MTLAVWKVIMPIENRSKLTVIHVWAALCGVVMKDTRCPLLGRWAVQSTQI